MARYRLSAPAKADIASLLRTSEAMHGAEARVRYRALLTAALPPIAADPEGFSTIDRSDLVAELREVSVPTPRPGPCPSGAKRRSDQSNPRRAASVAANSAAALTRTIRSPRWRCIAATVSWSRPATRMALTSLPRNVRKALYKAST